MRSKTEARSPSTQRPVRAQARRHLEASRTDETYLCAVNRHRVSAGAVRARHRLRAERAERTNHNADPAADADGGRYADPIPGVRNAGTGCRAVASEKWRSYERFAATSNEDCGRAFAHFCARERTMGHHSREIHLRKASTLPQR